MLTTNLFFDRYYELVLLEQYHLEECKMLTIYL